MYCVGDHLKAHIFLCLSILEESKDDLYSRLVPDIMGVIILYIYCALGGVAVGNMLLSRIMGELTCALGYDQGKLSLESDA